MMRSRAERDRCPLREHGDDRRSAWTLTSLRHGAGLETILVLTGLTTRELAEREPYRASRVIDSIADLLPELD